MIFGDVVVLTNEDEVISKIVEIYYSDPKDVKCFSDEEFQNLMGNYRRILANLRAAELKDPNMVIVVSYVKSDPDLDGPNAPDGYWDVAGRFVEGCEDPDDPYSGRDYLQTLAFHHHEEWASMMVDIPAGMSEVEFVAHCLWEMTFYGFTNEDIDVISDLVEDGFNEANAESLDLDE